VPPASWLLLIYTVPAEPSRKRALVWRELKKAGAVYLRDGVCALPERAAAAAAFRAIAATIEGLGGRAVLAEGARLDRGRADAIVAESRAARAAEYGEIARDADRLLEHVRRERGHRDLSRAELAALEADLGKLRRWADQVRARDYFAAPEAGHASGAIERSAAALAALREAAAPSTSAAR
jgi:hypothetical protein